LRSAAIVYLPIVVHRTVVSHLGDVQVFFRAGWAIWSGAVPLYEVTDYHGWHFHYPPTFALFMVPFSNPVASSARPAWALPYPASVAVWYVLCAAAMFMAVHLWATALERHSGLSLTREGHTGWALRLGPVIALLPYFGDGLGRGQPTGIVVLLLVAFLTLYAQAKRPAAAIVLSLAIAIKIFPIAFILFPLLRRDWKSLFLISLFSALFLFVLPALFLGVDETASLYRTLWFDRLLGLAHGKFAPRVEGEWSPWTDDMVALGAMLARTFDVPRPEDALGLPAWAAMAQWVANALIVLLIAILGFGKFWSLRAPQPRSPYAILAGGAILMAALPAMLPVAQPHYWAQAMPLAALLMTEFWRRTGDRRDSALLAAWSVLAWLAFIATDVRLWRPLQHHGPTTIVMLVLIAAGFRAMAALTGCECGGPQAKIPLDTAGATSPTI
jgi:hypothetical protein